MHGLHMLVGGRDHPELGARLLNFHLLSKSFVILETANLSQLSYLELRGQQLYLVDSHAHVY